MRSLLIPGFLFLGLTIVGAQCVAPPPYTLFWAPLDEAGSTVHNVANLNQAGVDVGGPAVMPGKVDDCRCYDGVGQYSEFSDDSSVNIILTSFFNGDFTIDCWIKVPTTANLSGVRTILDKRKAGGFGIKGYAVYLYDGYLGFQLADGGYANYIANVPSASSQGPLQVVPGQWHHVAVSVDRDVSTGGTLYLDTQPWTFDPTAHQGSLINDGPLRIAARTVNGAPDGYFEGCVDEVEIAHSVVDASWLAAIFNAGSDGKCKTSTGFAGCATAGLSVSNGQGCVVFPGVVSNQNAVAKTYTYTLSSLPAWVWNNGNPPHSWSLCTIPGPTQFFPASGTITVGPFSQGAITPVVNRPAGTGQACFKILVVDTSNLKTFEGIGNLNVNNSPINATNCGLLQSPKPVVAGQNRVGTTAFRLQNTGPAAITTNYRVEVLNPELTTDTEVVSLNDRPPGTPVLGTMTLQPGQIQTVQVFASFVRKDPMRDYSIIICTDITGAMMPVDARDLADTTPNTLTLTGEIPEPGRIDLGVLNAPPMAPMFSFFTGNFGAFPNGWLFGLDPLIPEFQFEYTLAAQGIAPFLLTTDVDGRASWSAVGFPPGLTFYGNSLTFDPTGTGVLASNLVILNTH